MFARFDEIQSLPFEDIKETKHHGWADNVKTVYPETNTVCGGGGGGGGGGEYYKSRSDEPRREKTSILHMRKQRRRSASR